MLTPGARATRSGINNNPTESSAAFAAVYAAALANGGSLDNIKPGVDYFQKLNKNGNFVATIADPTTVENGTTNIVIWWDYLQATEVNSLQVLEELEGRHPDVTRVLRRVLRPGHQQGRSEPGGGPPVGGVPLLGHRPEPVAPG